MIKVKLTKNNNYYKRIIITGHANYDDFGKDIVCAAVSSTVITSVNSCLAIDNESISYEDKNGLDIKVLKDDEVTTKIINVMVTNLYELEKAYPKNIKLRRKIMNRLMEFNIQLFAHKKGQSSTSNGRDSAGRRLGAKASDGEYVTAGSIIYRQRGTKIHPGTNVGRGTDDTLFAKISGYVKYSRLGRDRKQVSVYETK